MPLDYRRFNGPEDSVSYNRFTKEYLKSYDELQCGLLNEKELRKDGRALDEARTKFARTDMISQAKGSSYLELGRTKVICSVFDPREIAHQNEFSTLGQLYCEVKFAPFSCPKDRRSLVPDAEEKALSVTLRKALEPTVCRHLFPNFQVDIFVYVLENNGACLAAAINAAGLALANAAVPMYDIVTSSSVAIIKNKMFIDPTVAEENLAMMGTDEESNNGIITISMLSTLKQLSNFRQIGSMDVDCVLAATEMLQKECKNILPIVQKVLVHNVVQNQEQQKILEEEEKKMEAALKAKLEEWKILLNSG